MGLVAALLIGPIGISTQWIRAESHARAAILAAEKQRKAKDKAEKAERAALETADKLEREAYRQRIARAYQEWEDNNIIPAEKLLDECPEALRGWEWRYCKRLCHQGLFTYRNHRGTVLYAVFSPDGQLVASITEFGQIHLWNAQTGERRFSFEFPTTLYDWIGEKGRILAFSPDSSQLAAACEDGVVRVWNVAEGQEVVRIDGQGKYVASIAFSPDSKRLAIGHGDDLGKPTPINIFDLDLRSKVVGLNGHQDGVNGLVFTNDGKFLVSGGRDGEVAVWNIKTGSVIQSWFAEGGQIFDIALSPDERSVAVAMEDDSIRVWDMRTGQVQTLQGHTNDVLSDCFSSDGKSIVSGSYDKSIKIWDAHSARALRTIRGHTGGVSKASLSSNNNRIVSASIDGTVRIWDITDNQQYHEVSFSGQIQRTNTGFSPDGKFLTTCVDTLRCFDMVRGQEIAIPSINMRGKCAQFSADGAILAVEVEGGLKLWDWTDDRERILAEPIPSGVNWLCFSSKNHYLAVAHENLVTVVDHRTAKTVFKHSDHERSVRQVCFGSDGVTCVSLDDEGTLLAYDVSSGQRKFTRKAMFGGKYPVMGSGSNLLIASPLGQFVISGGVYQERGEVYFVDAASGEIIQKLQGHTSSILALAINRTGTRLYTGSQDGTVKIWDLHTGQELFTIPVFSGVTSLAISPDDNHLAVCRLEKTIRTLKRGAGRTCNPPHQSFG